jgi:hypothetical protein
MPRFEQRNRDENGQAMPPLGGGSQPTSGGDEKCLARGCPLPGTVSDSTKGGGPWTCSAHRRAAPEQWDAVSFRATSAPWLWRAINRITHDGATMEFAEQVSDVCRKRGLEGLAFQPAYEELRQWAFRLRLGAIGWAETGEVRSVPFGLRQQTAYRRPEGLGKLAAMLVQRAHAEQDAPESVEGKQDETELEPA